MNVRVLLPVLMTGLFMALWNGDQAAMEAALARRAQAQATMMVNTTPSDTVRPVERRADAGLPVSLQKSSVRNTEITPVADFVPLPSGLPAGDYQAVSQSGQMMRLSIQSDPQNRQSASSAKDCYSTESPDGTRWFFVRVSPVSRL